RSPRKSTRPRATSICWSNSTWTPAPTSAISSTSACRRSPASRTRARSSRSRRFRKSPRRWRRGAGLDPGARPFDAQLALAPDHEQPGGRNDDRAEKDERRRGFSKHHVAERERPHHGSVIERRKQRSGREAIAFGEQNVRDAAQHADRHKFDE